MNTRLDNAATFICGYPKSGTSLIMALLDHHPQMVVYPEESGFFRRLAEHAAGLSLEDCIKLAEELLIHIFHWDSDNPHPSQDGFLDREYKDISFTEVRESFHSQLERLGKSYPNILPAAVLAFGEVSKQLNSGTLR